MFRNLFTFIDQLAAHLEVDSLSEFARYLLVAYVTRATDTFNDRQLSGLLAKLKGPRDYSEEAQRMWRFRNKRRLDKHFNRIADMLLDLGVVISRRT